MSYIRADEILPSNLVDMIQKYIDGENIYIPRKESNKKEWGSKTSIRQELMEFRCFMENDYKLARKYGTNKSIFVKNKAEIDWSSIDYQIISKNSEKLLSDELINYKAGDYIQLCNPLGLNIRSDKIIADVLGVTRSKLKQIYERGIIDIVKSNLTNNVDIIINSEIYDIES